jgi:hypothetical protein
VKNIFLLLGLLFFVVIARAQSNYWQQQANFTITVSLNDKEHTLDAFETIEYINNSPDTLHFIWFHIWPNAYKNDQSALSEQLLQEGRTDFYFSKPANRGYINQLNFKAGGSNAKIITDSANIDIIKVLLPTPLQPKGKTIITTPFRVKLPYNFSRGGHVARDYQVTQWFPKPAVYDQKGWHPMPYLDQGEFYSEFGNFDVDITVPSAYVVGATGVLQDAETLQQLKENGKPTIEGETKSWHYKQNNVHDFAWFASKNFIVKYDTVILASKKVVDVFTYTKPTTKGWSESMKYAKDGLRSYSNWLGEYPYTVATVVQGSQNVNSGGMEYPTITLITTTQSGRELDATIVHEIGHNWFYGALASNERNHPWMDEGMNTFYQKRYESSKYSTDLQAQKLPFNLQNKLPEDEDAMLFATVAKMHKDQPIETSSENFTSTNYGLSAYYKASSWMKKLQDELGNDLFDSCMKAYYKEWQFKHPYPEDFKASIEKTSGRNVDNIFSVLNQTGRLANSATRKTIKPSFLFNFNDKHNYINFATAVGYNTYDKVMVGAFIHNYKLPLNNLQFFAGALYATGSKKINPFGRISHNIYKRNYNISTALSYISYSQNDFTVDNNTRLIMGLKRWVPSVKATFFDKNPLSTRQFSAEWKTFLLNEGALEFKTITTPTDTFETVGVVNQKTYINRLSLSVSDNRVLYPYSLTLAADQGKEFVRAGLTGKLYFNYSQKNAGLSARFFAGKFFYLHPARKNTLYLDRYFLNVSGPKGNADYTYSDYFIGRNEFEGKNGKSHWQNQQIMERDAFFKVNTDQVSYFGQTDNWLMALNLVSDVGNKPLFFKVFLDVGTYAEAWKNNPASGRFIYDAGFQVPLFKSLINIYVPIIYSKVYSDYYKSYLSGAKFWKKISFNINIEKLQPKQLLKDVPL